MASPSTASHRQLSSPSAGSTSIASSPPEVLTFRYDGESVYVMLPDSFQSAQDAAVTSLRGLADVDPRHITFNVSVRVKSTRTRETIVISPQAWTYVTSRLVNYRVVDIRVCEPPSPSKKSHAALSSAPSYPDSPPPKYPGLHSEGASPKLPGYGVGYGQGFRYPYGFSWDDQHAPHPSQQSRVHNFPGSFVDPNEQLYDDRAVGNGRQWYRPPALLSNLTRLRRNGFGIFPITWQQRAGAQPQRYPSSPRQRRHSESAHKNRQEVDRLTAYTPSLV